MTHSGISLRLSGQGSGIAEKWEIFLFANGGRVLEATGPGKWKAGFNNEAGYLALNFYLNALYKYKVDSFDVLHDQAAFTGGVTSQFNRETYIIGAMKTDAPNRKYGITQVSYQSPLRLERVKVPGGTNLRWFSEAADIPYQTLKEFNPELKRDMAPGNREEYLLKVPAAMKKGAAEAAQVCWKLEG